MYIQKFSSFLQKYIKSYPKNNYEIIPVFDLFYKNNQLKKLTVDFQPKNLELNLSSDLFNSIQSNHTHLKKAIENYLLYHLKVSKLEDVENPLLELLKLNNPSLDYLVFNFFENNTHLLQFIKKDKGNNIRFIFNKFSKILSDEIQPKTEEEIFLNSFFENIHQYFKYITFNEFKTYFSNTKNQTFKYQILNLSKNFLGHPELSSLIYKSILNNEFGTLNLKAFLNAKNFLNDDEQKDIAEKFNFSSLQNISFIDKRTDLSIDLFSEQFELDFLENHINITCKINSFALSIYSPEFLVLKNNKLFSECIFSKHTAFFHFNEINGLILFNLTDKKNMFMTMIIHDTEKLKIIRDLHRLKLSESTKYQKITNNCLNSQFENSDFEKLLFDIQNTFSFSLIQSFKKVFELEKEKKLDISMLNKASKLSAIRNSFSIDQKSIDYSIQYLRELYLFSQINKTTNSKSIKNKIKI